MASSKPSTYDLTVHEARDYASPEQGWEDLATARSRRSWRSGDTKGRGRGICAPGRAVARGGVGGEAGMVLVASVAGDYSPELCSAAELRCR